MKEKNDTTPQRKLRPNAKYYQLTLSLILPEFFGLSTKCDVEIEAGKCDS